MALWPGAFIAGSSDLFIRLGIDTFFDRSSQIHRVPSKGIGCECWAYRGLESGLRVYRL